MSGIGWLLERFRSAERKIAFIHNDDAMTYGELLDCIADFTRTITQSKIEPGQRVAILGDYTPQAYALMLALAANSNIIIPFTQGSVVEEAAALSITGLDWIFEFSPDLRLPTLVRRHEQVENPLIRELINDGKPGIVLFSSGSTGQPKGILHDFERVAAKFVVQRDAVIAIPFLMFDHFGGLNTVLAITASLGTVVSIKDRSVEKICAAIETHKIQLLPTTPSFLNLMIAAKAHETHDLSSLKRVTYGTEVMPQTTLDRLGTALPNVTFQQTYGLSEVGVLASKSRPDGSLWMRLGGPGFQTKVVDDVLWIKSDFAMKGYLNAPAAFDADGWFNTQDKVEVDGDYVRILGRVTDVINVGGQKVYPAEVESVIMSLPNIVDVAVLSEDHALLGKIIVAKVVTLQPEPAIELKSRIRIACKERLAPFKAPSKIISTVDTLYSVRFKKNRS